MTHLLFACAAAFAVAALPAQDPTAPAAPAAPAAKAAAAQAVGTIDLIRVFEQNPKWAKAKSDLARMQEQFKAQIGKLSERIAELNGLIESTAEDSDDRRSATFDREMMMRQREFLAKQASERLESENARAMLAVYQDVERAIAPVAKARGVAIVHRLQAIGAVPGEIGKLAPKEVEARVVAFERKVVWYAASELDLTEDLIKALMVPVADDKPAPQESAAQPGKAAPKTDGAPKVGG
ncbi:MAG: OmpH family outer membrane protein [Planctomycetota bacterium]